MSNPDFTARSRRENLYRQWFGDSVDVSHELLPLEPHVDVYRYAPAGWIRLSVPPAT